jgi:hypothetical protein
MKKINPFKSLSKKVAMVFGASLAALTASANSQVAQTPSSDISGGNTIEFSQKKALKPVGVLKLNLRNVESSKFVAAHESHSSHSSHYSHYSHRSGAMIS